jgi:hypothetical protein
LLPCARRGVNLGAIRDINMVLVATGVQMLIFLVKLG